MELILEGCRRIRDEGKDSRFEYGEEYLTAATYAGLAFLQAGCATVHAMSFPLGGTYHVPHGEANYLLFGKVLEKYNAMKPYGKIADFKKTIARIIGGTERDCDQSFKRSAGNRVAFCVRCMSTDSEKKDIELFTDSVILNQQRLVTNSYVPLTRELIVEIYTELY